MTFWLTGDVAGIGGEYRASPEDFVVEERLVRAPRGKGPLVWARLEKRGLSTPELLRRLGSALGVRTTELSAAGFKDARAVTTQWVALPGRLLPALRAASIEDVKLLEAANDDEPLSSRLIAGNAFVVVVRGCDASDPGLERAAAILATLGREGVPNWYGPQRFGTRGEAAAIGAALLEGDLGLALDLVLGRPSDAEHDPRAREFREAYERGDFEAALARCPGALRVEKRLLERLAKGEEKPAVARGLPVQDARFWLSAWQSLLFNRVLAARLATRCVRLEGDVLEDGIPTGPLFGSAMPKAAGEAGAIESAVLRASGFDDPARLRAPFRLPLHGKRRPLVVLPRDVVLRRGASESTVEVAFELPAGAFATSLLGELTKAELPILDSPPPFSDRPAAAE